MKAKRWTLVTAAVLLSAGTAQAQKAGDWVVGAGALYYAPQDSSQPLQITHPVHTTVPGSGADVRGTGTLGLNLHYFLTDNWAVEGVFGVPPRINLDGSGTFGPIGRLGHGRLYAPSVLAKYFFGQADDRFRVSVGAGVTYTSFRSVRLTQGLQGAMGGALGLPPGASTTSAKIGSKWSPVLNVGANYAIDKHWGVTASISWMPLKMRANLDTQVGGQTVARSTTKIKVNPVIPFVYLTYRF